MACDSQDNELPNSMFIKILQPPLGWQNLDRTIAYTRFHRIKGGGGVPPSPNNNFDRVDEIRRFL